MKTINQKNKWSKRFALVTYKSVSYFLIVGLLFLTSCNSSSDSVSPSGEDPYVITEADFFVHTSFLNKAGGYGDFYYGTSFYDDNKQFKFGIKDLKKDGESFSNVVAGSDSEEKIITVNSFGRIGVKAGLAEGEYSFTLTVDGNSAKGYSGSFEEELKLDIVPDEGKEDIDPLKITILGNGIKTIQKDYTGSTFVFSYFEPSYVNTLNLEFVEFVGEDGESFIDNVEIKQIENDTRYQDVILSKELPVGLYKLKAKFSGDKYNGKYETGFFKLVVEELGVKGRYNFTKGTTEAEYGYDEEIEYGKIERNEGVPANFSISENIAGGGVSVDTEGNIKIAQGVPAGEHTFKVKITGTGEYARGGSVEESYTVKITPAPINATDFAINYYYITREEGYEVGESYGKITLEKGVTADFFISDEIFFTTTIGSNEIAISESGDITLKKQLDEGTYYFGIGINGTGNYQGDSTYNFGFKVIQIGPGKTFVDENDFTFDVPLFFSLEEGYADGTVIGKISSKENSPVGTINAGSFTKFSSKYSSALHDDKIIREETTGEVKLKAGLEVGVHTFSIEIDATDPYVGGFVKRLVLSVVPKKE